MRIAVLLLLCLVIAAPARAQPSTSAATSEPGSELRVWLVTAGPGDAVWERYGHNAIRVLDTASGHDVSYNWGIFDFNQRDFLARFLRGQMLYSMAVFPTARMIDSYRRANREVVLQELALTPSQRAALRDLAEVNALPENRDYVYHYFLDNCSTRVRDLLDRVLGGALQRQFDAVPTNLSYRFHTRRLAQPDPLIAVGMDALLGSPTDARISVWDEMFLPGTLSEALRSVRVADPAGGERSLVASEEIVVPSSRDRARDEPRSWLLVLAVLGALLGGLGSLPALPRWRASSAVRVGALVVGVSWSLLAGVLGTILVLLLLTDHGFAHWNENLFLFTPLSLLLAPLLVLAGSGRGWNSSARALALGVLALALAGVVIQPLPGAVQQNAGFIFLAVPAHLGVFLLTSSLAARRPS